MLGFYNAIYEVNPNHQNITLTVIKGDAFGEKALMSNREIIWKSKNSEFFTRNGSEIKKIEDGGIYEIESQSVFCELLGQEKKIVICGGGHVSIPIIQMGIMIGCHVTVLEERPKFADNARRAGASEVICKPFSEGLESIKGDKDTFFVIVTRGHRYDQLCLESIVRKEHAYIGMIGSRKRAAIVKETIIRGGAKPEIVDHIHTPIGLDIGAETPEEIAVSILAEIIEVKNKNKRTAGYSRDLMKAILNSEAVPSTEGAKVLATIVTRKGPAPREVGTKMLILSDGSCIGTIGGGCVESDILREALSMLRQGKSGAKLCHVDMTGRDAEDEGMICGGIIDVLLEMIV